MALYRFNSFYHEYEYNDGDSVREFKIDYEVDPSETGELNILEILETEGPNKGKVYTEEEFTNLTRDAQGQGESAFDLADANYLSKI